MKDNKEDDIVDIQKNYSEEILSEIQHAIDSNLASIKILSTIDELPKTIYIDGIKLVFTHNSRYSIYMYCDDYHDKNTGDKWKTEPLNKFYVRDWKSLNDTNIDIFKDNNYLEILFKVKNADVVALLRRVDIELADDSFLLMEYGDITYNNSQYTIIKAYCPTINEYYNTKSILENINFSNKYYDNNGSEIKFSADGKHIETDEFETISLEDVTDPESEELF